MAPHPFLAELDAAKLNKSGDGATGQITGPNGITPSSYITQDQVAQGVKRPLLFAQNITTGNTALVPALADPLGKNRSALVLKIYLFMTVAPGVGLGATVKIGTTPGGSDVLNKVYLLAALPGINTLLELNMPTLTVLPPNTMLYATASSGSWTCAVDCFYIN